MICSNGKEVIQEDTKEASFICQSGKYEGKPCPWVKFCHVIQLYNIDTHLHGGIKKCNHFAP